MAVLTMKSEEFKTFPSYLKEYASYMTAIRGKAEKTVCEYLLDLRTFFRYTIMIKEGKDLTPEEFEKISISSITFEDIAEVKYETIVSFLGYTAFQRNNNTSTRNRKISSLRSFYKYMCDKKKYIDHNPPEGVDSPQKAKTLPKYLTLEESVRLLETIRADKESKTVQRDYSIVALFLNTGMRLSELCGLNLESFDSDVSYVKVIGKGNKERVIYLNNAARDAIISYLHTRLDPRYIRTSDHALFLSGRQTRISPKTVQFIVHKYLGYAGLGSRGLSVHKLRHTAATLMYQSGKVDIRVLKDVLGHEQLNTTQIYTHVVSTNLEQAMYNNPLSEVIVKEEK